MLLVFVLHLLVQVLPQLQGLLRQQLYAASSATFMGNGGLRCQQGVLELLIRGIVPFDCLRLQKALELLMLSRSEVFLLRLVALCAQIALGGPAEAACLADLALLLMHVPAVLVQIVVDAWTVQVL